MAVYFVTGKLGSGKTLVAVSRIREYLKAGKRVASNVEINIAAMFPADTLEYQKERARLLTRLPDKPDAHDMAMIGQGYTGDYDENKFGLIVLDELGTWLNSRSWSDKSRRPFIDWLIHARKLHWDIIFLVQNVAMVDAQARDALCEHLVICKRADRVKIAGIRLPKIHVGVVYYGSTEKDAMKLERWVYRGTDLYSAYDTAQAFSPFYDLGVYIPIPEKYYDENKQIEEIEEVKPTTKSLIMYTFVGAVIAGGLYHYLLFMPAVESKLYAEEIAQEAKSEIDKIKSAQNANWLSGLGAVHLAGEYTSGEKTTIIFSTQNAGTVNSSYFESVGAKISKVNRCTVAIQWPDSTVDMVYCDKTELEI